MTDSFMHDHQSALDSQREDDAIRDLEDAGIYPDPDNELFKSNLELLDFPEEDSIGWNLALDMTEEDEANYPSETDDDYEPTDDEVMSSFGTKWHDGL